MPNRPEIRMDLAVQSDSASDVPSRDLSRLQDVDSMHIRIPDN
jgi:hypothetical protein